MNPCIRTIGIFIVFLLLPLIHFRDYVFGGKIPFSANLLVSYYSPWRDDPVQGYENGAPNKPMGFDNVRIFYPNIAFTVEEFKKGIVPLWNPYIFSGTPHAAQYQTAIYYPLNILYGLLPTIDAWSILVVVQPILTAIFMYLFLGQLPISLAGRIFGSLAFAYSGWMMAWWEDGLVLSQSIVWLPLVLYAVSSFWNRKHQCTHFIFIVFGVSMSFLGGYMQMTIYLLFTAVLWHLYLWRKIRKEKGSFARAGIVLFGFLIAALVTSIQWLPAFEAFLHSPRSFVDAKFLFDAYLMPFAHAFTAYVPDYWGNPGSYNYFSLNTFYHEKMLFIGVFPFLFALATFWYKKNNHLKFWQLYTIIVVSLGFALPTSWIWYTLHIPMLESALPSRIFVLAAFGMSVLSAYGMSQYQVDGKSNVYKKILTALSLGIVIAGAYAGLSWVHTLSLYERTCVPSASLFVQNLCRFVALFYDKDYGIYYATTSLRNLIVPSAFMLAAWILVLFLWRSKRFVIISVTVLSIVSSLYFSHKYLYFSDRRLVYPTLPVIEKLQEIAGLDRVWGYGDAYVENNILSYFHLYSAEGYGPVFPLEYATLIGVIRNDGKWSTAINRADVELSSIADDTSIIDNPYRAKLFALLGIRYLFEEKNGPKKSLLTTERRFPETAFSLNWQNEKWRIWEYKAAMPRAYFVSSYDVISDNQKAVDRLFETNFSLQSRVIVETDPKIPSSDSQTNESINIVSYQSNDVVIISDTSQDGIIVLTDTFDTGWHATVDNVAVPILRTNIAFRGIAVSTGKHTIHMWYEPKSFLIGRMITVISLSFLSVIILIAVIRSARLQWGRAETRGLRGQRQK